MIRKTLTLPVAAFATIAMLGTAMGATTERTQGTVQTMDRAAMSATLSDGTRLQFGSAAQMQGVFAGVPVYVSFFNGGDRNVVTQLRVQPYR